MPLGIVANQVERIGNLAFILELIDATARDNLGRELRLAPADIHRRDHMEEQIGRNAR